MTDVPARTAQPPSPPVFVVAGHDDQSLTDLLQVHILDHCLSVNNFTSRFCEAQAFP
jgi:hypothetical protein